MVEFSPYPHRLVASRKDGDFWDIPFDRKQCYGIAQMNNTFTLSTKPDLKLTVTGFVHSKAIQGIYDLPTSGNVNIALRYGFAKNKAILNLYCNDILRRDRFLPASVSRRRM